MTNKTLGLLIPVFAAACESTPTPSVNAPSSALLEDAKLRAERSVSSLEQARAALEMLGILPTYDCVAGRNEYVAAAVARLPEEIPCASLSTAVVDGMTDEITATLPDAGCEVLGHHVEGVLVVRITGGTDTFAVEVDAHDLVVDGNAVQALAGYGTCGDETQYWVAAEGSVPGHAGSTFVIDAQVGKRSGLPVIGGTTLIIDGSAAVTTAGATDSVTMTGLEYELGDLLPKNGTIVIQTPEHRIEVTFDLDSPIIGDVTVKVDSYSAVTIPVV